jgi:hypothetical protein
VTQPLDQDTHAHVTHELYSGHVRHYVPALVLHAGIQAQSKRVHAFLIDIAFNSQHRDCATLKPVNR